MCSSGDRTIRKILRGWKRFSEGQPVLGSKLCGRSFSSLSNRGSGLCIPALPKAKEFDQLIWSDIIGKKSQQGLLGRLESWQTGDWIRLEEGTCFSESLDPN